MIINKLYKFIYYAPGKTGTTSIEKWLNDNFRKTERHGKKHISLELPGTKDYFRFASVRNPWTRIVSEYLYRRQIGQLRPKTASFEEFVLKHLTANHMFIKDMFKNIRIDQFVRQEHLEKDLSRLPFVDFHVQLPKLNVTKFKAICLFSQEMQEYILSICDDFQYGNYDKECPDYLKAGLV